MIHFDHTIIKIDKHGNKVLSAHLDKGEELEDGRTYADVKVRHEGPEVPPLAEPDDSVGLTADEGNNGTVPVEPKKNKKAK